MSEADSKQSFGFRHRLMLARAAAAVEAVWPALWPCVAIAGLFLIVSLFGLWAWLPGWLHFLGLLGFAATLGYTLWRAWPALRWPSRDAGLRRLEQTNALPHQPLRSLSDRLSGGGSDPGTLSLWQRHRERLLRRLIGLRVGPPRSDLPRRDPWALRAALLLVLVIAVADAGSMFTDRLGQAFELRRPDRVSTVPLELAVWVTPPAYTGLPPVRLQAQPTGVDPAAVLTPFSAMQIPVGSEALAQLHHLRTPPSGFSLSLDESRQPFTGVGRNSAEARLMVEESGALKVVRGTEELGSWQIQAVPDQPPQAAFVGQPGPTQRSTLRVEFEATDDYGLTSIALHMHRPEAETELERLELVRPANQATEITDTAFLDLTPHPWAGLPVVVWVEAVDGLDQIGQSEAVEIVLPAREFHHPLARAIIEERRQLVADPEQKDHVASDLDRLSQNPTLYQHDPTVFLALRSAAQRLLSEGTESMDDVLELLWETALHLEDGSLSIAERQLRELERALREALAEGASDEELERLMAELEQAMEAYLDELARQAQEMMAQDQHEMMPIDPNAMQLRREDFQQMLDMMREMIRTGAREAAQQMLAQLQEMLENLQVAQQGQQGQGQQMMNQLQEMIERQQSLLDQTYGLSREQQQQDWSDRFGQEGQEGQQGQFGQEGQQGQQGQFGQGQQGQFGQGQMGQGRPGGQQGGAQTGQLAMDQETLRRALGELMGQLGDSGMQIPRSLGGAELAMRGARDALQGGQPGEALDPQAQALDLLRQGGQAMLQDMQQMLGQGQGQGEVTGQPFGQNPDGRDPLGRSMYNQGGADLFGERVPTELDLGRARAIMEELHRRSSQRNRPSEELDYLQRLLKRF